jgi:hypothetical protein
MGDENRVEELLRKFDLGNSEKIVRAILLTTKKRTAEAIQTIEELQKSSDRWRYSSILFRVTR